MSTPWPSLGLDEYLTRLSQRAVNGDKAAAEELDRWNRLLSRPRTRPQEAK